MSPTATASSHVPLRDVPELLRHGAWVSAVWVSVALTVIAFFLPWVSIGPRPSKSSKPTRQEVRSGQHKSNVRMNGELSRVFNKVGQDLSRAVNKMTELRIRITGVQIPRMANREQTKVAMDLVEHFTKQRQHVGLKSYAVYLVPGLALLCGGLLARFRRHKVAAGMIAVVCAGAAVGGAWELVIVGAQQYQNGVLIEYGLWLSLLGYAGLASAALVALFPNRVQWWVETRALRSSAVPS